MLSKIEAGMSAKVKMSRLMTKPTKWHVRPAKTQDQPGHPPSLIRVFTVRMKKVWILNYLLSAQRRLWSDWVDAQADLTLRWVHMPFCQLKYDVKSPTQGIPVIEDLLCTLFSHRKFPLGMQETYLQIKIVKHISIFETNIVENPTPIKIKLNVKNGISSL